MTVQTKVVTAELKCFNNAKGYGFLRGPEGDIFIHADIIRTRFKDWTARDRAPVPVMKVLAMKRANGQWRTVQVYDVDVKQENQV